ncbi:MAG TPA: PIN domain-containing protein [Gemmataceae bacterium]|nr:PIN domain-containing protein [Gemmataceae bacterium]
MGALSVPTSGIVYVDTMTVIYTVERYPAYWPLLEPLWQAAQSGTIEIVSSELTLMEKLVGPLKSRDTNKLENAFEQALLGTEVRLFPITQPILREAAQLRATTKLRTPDALHAATGLHLACVQFVTNDVGFRAVPSLPLVILDDLLKP